MGDAKFLHHSLGGTDKVKTLRKQCAVVILTLTMAVSAYAGIMQTPGYATSENGTTTPASDTDIAITLVVTVVKIVP